MVLQKTESGTIVFLIQLDIRFNKKLSKLASLRQISRKKDKMISTKAICRKSKSHMVWRLLC